MAPAEGVPHEKYEGGKGAKAYLVYTWHDPAKGYYLLAYGGRRMRPDAYYRYQTEEQRDKARDERLASYHEKIAAAEREKAVANPLKVGDLLRSSWGYDQTNVDYYQVTKVTKRSVEIREVGLEHVEGSGCANGMADRVRPRKDKFLSEPKRKLVQVWVEKDGTVRCSVKVRSFAYAYPCSEDETTYRSWYH
jgi:hypothetical protein